MIGMQFIGHSSVDVMQEHYVKCNKHNKYDTSHSFVDFRYSMHEWALLLVGELYFRLIFLAYVRKNVIWIIMYVTA